MSFYDYDNMYILFFVFLTPLKSTSLIWLTVTIFLKWQRITGKICQEMVRDGRKW